MGKQPEATPRRVRRKDSFLEAIQYDGTNDEAIMDWSGEEWTLDVGDWIVCDEHGLYHCCYAEHFQDMFEEVEDDV
jgi:hypothetical protein